jgi:hypothetical protein
MDMPDVIHGYMDMPDVIHVLKCFACTALPEVALLPFQNWQVAVRERHACSVCFNIMAIVTTGTWTC